jgi:hypothetical protein
MNLFTKKIKLPQNALKTAKITSEKPREMANDLCETANDLLETANDLLEMVWKLCETAWKLCEMANDLKKTSLLVRSLYFFAPTLSLLINNPNFCFNKVVY